jgi:tetratricopeptide (TPR) repeat protein
MRNSFTLQALVFIGAAIIVLGMGIYNIISSLLSIGGIRGNGATQASDYAKSRAPFNIDLLSEQKQGATTPNERERIGFILQTIDRAKSTRDNKQKEKILISGYKQAAKWQDDVAIALIYTEIAYYMLNFRRDVNKAKSSILKAAEHYELNADFNRAGKILVDFANALQQYQQYMTAIEILYVARNIYRRREQWQFLASVYEKRGEIYLQMRRPNDSQVEYFNAKNIYEKTRNYSKLREIKIIIDDMYDKYRDVIIGPAYEYNNSYDKKTFKGGIYDNDD